MFEDVLQGSILGSILFNLFLCDLLIFVEEADNIRQEARKPEVQKFTFATSCSLITQYNPLLPNLKTIVRSHLSILYNNQQMLYIFPRAIKQSENSIEECNKNCDICKKFFVVSTEFTYFSTRWKYKIEGIWKCDSENMIYLISCKCSGKQYVGSATGIKEQFRIQKGDINTGKVICSVANYLLNACCSSGSKFEYLQAQLTEKVSV